MEGYAPAKWALSQGYVTCEPADLGNPCYHITDAGKAEFEKSVRKGK